MAEREPPEMPLWMKNLSEGIAWGIEEFLMVSRYLLVLMYCSLMFLICRLIADFYKLLIGTAQVSKLTEDTFQALDLLDITMVANLIWFISAGSYYVFVRPYPGKVNKRLPRSLAHISTGILKEKMAGSILSVSSVYLLQIFLSIPISTEPVDVTKIAMMVAICLVFVIILVAFNFTNSAAHLNHPENTVSVKSEG